MKSSDKILCLGKEFTSEEERREYFRNELRAKLPELKKIEGFPIGEDEDIINLSDPPYYTACPNPWLNDFIAEWEKEKETTSGRKKDFHVDKPYASDISEGKYDPIYKMHPYHTKVPHFAIMRYLMHYTQPGDIVFDGFAGTGMTGVACKSCANPDATTKHKLENEFVKIGLQRPVWGARNPILGDLSTMSGFISYIYNTSIDSELLGNEIESIISKVKIEFPDLFATKHSNGEIGRINSIFWSDVFLCNNCNKEIVFWEEAVDKEQGLVKEIFHCSHCNQELTKDKIDLVFETQFDSSLNQAVKQAKRIPVLINYEFKAKKYSKKPDVFDFAQLDKINNIKIPYWHPILRMCEGAESRRNDKTGVTHVHQFYFKRNLLVLSKFYDLCDKPYLLQFLTAVAFRITKRYSLTYQSGTWGAGGGPTSGTLYIPSLIKDLNIFDMIEQAVTKRLKINNKSFKPSPIYTQSSTALKISDNSIDYMFLDPPFGSNLNYSELNFIWESWLKVTTNNKEEAIENKTQKKGIVEYKQLLMACLREAYRILKPGKWLTVEFSNTKAAVWNVVQTSLSEAGFIIANVAALDKQKGSFISLTTPTAVKQDLVISCYKPSDEFVAKFISKSNDISVWDFIKEHFNHLPIHVKKDNNTTAIVERSPKIIYDRLITFYLMRGLPIPIDAKDFQDGLKQRFVERDGMYYTAEQAAEYDEKKAKAPQFVQLSLIVTNESDAIEWLKDRLRKQAQKYQDIMPDFRIATQSLRKGDSLPELQDILNENFIQEPDGRWRTPDPNEAKDREALRTKVLLKEFNGYVTAISQPRAKKLKEVRVEALRAGFKNCWEQKDFKTIVTLGDMIPQNILLEDEQLLMYYDIAKDRV